MPKYSQYNDINEAMEDALEAGTVWAECKECGEALDVEPDATTSFCYKCNKVVDVINPLIEEGLI